MSPIAKKSNCSIELLYTPVEYDRLLVYNEFMQTLRETIQEFKSAGKAIGHFNFSDSN